MEPTGIRTRLRSALTERMRARDRDGVAAVRAALAAIDNAEAVPVADPGPLVGGNAYVATPALGAGAAEVERHELEEAQMCALVAAEADERAELSRRLGELGSSEEARRTFEQATFLRFLLDRGTEPGGEGR